MKGPVTFKRHNIDDLSEADARAIFGDELYENWIRWKAELKGAGVCTITSIERGTGTLTIGLPPENESDGT